MSEIIIGYGEVCRSHGIGGPEDLDTALYDYEALAQQIAILHEKFYKEAKPVRAQDGNYLCPSCGKRIREWYSHCNHCGKKVGWDGLLEPKKERFGCRGRQSRKEARRR